MLRERSVIPAAALLQVISFVYCIFMPAVANLVTYCRLLASSFFVRHADVFVAPQMCFS